MKSTADAVARRHRGTPEHEGGFNSRSTSWRNPHCVFSTGTELNTHENVADRKVALARRSRNVAMTNTWSLRNGASVNLEESGAFPPHFSNKTTNKRTSRFQKVNSGDAMSVMTSMADVVVRRHRGCLEHQGGFNTWSTSWQGPDWVAITRTNWATDENVASGKMRRRGDIVAAWNIKAASTPGSPRGGVLTGFLAWGPTALLTKSSRTGWWPKPGLVFTSQLRIRGIYMTGLPSTRKGRKEAFSPHFDEKTTTKKTSRLQNVNSGKIMRVLTWTVDAAARRHRGFLKHRGGFNT
ncbi:hypothetical protein MRX96_013804 [Rhipicephalus microplus]